MASKCSATKCKLRFLDHFFLVMKHNSSFAVTSSVTAMTEMETKAVTNPILPPEAYPGLGNLGGKVENRERDLRLCVAPMLDWTDRHERFFLRLITRHALLYTEMITTGALLYGDRTRFLGYDPAEHPVAAQLAGSDPRSLAECARLVEEHGYDEVNLNCGCPSPRVLSGRFGACLLAEPELVAECVFAMARAVSIPVTVKTRIGIDEQDAYQDLARFVATVANAGCDTFILHARKAWLGYTPTAKIPAVSRAASQRGITGLASASRKQKGLSPTDNRKIPPLRHDVVQATKEEFPMLRIVLNGGVENLEEAQRHLRIFDGVMIGRAAYRYPYRLALADQVIFGDAHPVPSRRDVIESFIPYVERQLAHGVPLAGMTRHILGLFSGRPGARGFRRHISEHAHLPGAGVEVIWDALGMV
uniref:tRNA-dihydrouridine(20/20a) synthase n=1 Tax=Candidatus Kentrum sp. DK TaxID=2126562 RepID=A0A450SE17_9GAMM|nr:MAG: tRNA-U16,U17-dihydrouridine synthase [Candidatus Kentron sp. DK]